MSWPWIDRSAHEAIVSLLQAQIVDLKAELSEMKDERTVVYDRLGAIGLGGPLFHVPAEVAQVAKDDPEVSEEEEEQATIQRLRRTPSKLAAHLTQKAYRDRNKLVRGPQVARIPDARMSAALEAAEEAGRKHGS